MSKTAKARHYASRQSPVQATWKAHRDLTRGVPRKASWHRRFVGLAAAVASSDSWITLGDQVFVPDQDLTWFTLQDFPPGGWAKAAPSRLAAVRRTRLGYDVPRIGDVTAAFDFSKLPGTEGEAVLDSVKHERWATIFNAVNWAMTSAAVHHTPGWSVIRGMYDAAIGALGTGNAVYLFGDSHFAHLDPPAIWLPTPYLGFPAEQRTRLWNRATVADAVGQSRYYPESLRRAFVADVSAGMPIVTPLDGTVVEITPKARRDSVVCTVLTVAGDEGAIEIVARCGARLAVAEGQPVRVGDVLGHDGPPLPPEWAAATTDARWDTLLPAMLGPSLLWVLRTWFLRWMRDLVPGFVHAPAALAAPAALGCADPSQLFWDLGPALPYFHEGLDTFIFPAVAAPRWDHFRLALTCDLELDLSPVPPGAH